MRSTTVGSTDSACGACDGPQDPQGGQQGESGREAYKEKLLGAAMENLQERGIYKGELRGGIYSWCHGDLQADS